jgi:hypothetical protein
MRMIKKITGKILGADKETILELVMKDKKSEVPLYNVVGGAFRATVEDSDNGMGEYVKLSGKFKGVSLLTGEEVGAGVAILPDVASNLIAGELLSSGDENSNAYAEIAMTITAKYEKGSASSYTYGVQVHNSNEDVFTKLEAMIPKKLMLTGSKS